MCVKISGKQYWILQQQFLFTVVSLSVYKKIAVFHQIYLVKIKSIEAERHVIIRKIHFLFYDHQKSFKQITVRADQK